MCARITQAPAKGRGLSLLLNLTLIRATVAQIAINKAALEDPLYV